MSAPHHGPLRVGVGGPVGSGKTALMDALCKRLRDRYEIAAITNDIYTKWDAEYLVRSGALAAERIAGVETGGCPHTAIREDASINLAAVADMRKKFPELDLVLIEFGRRQPRRDVFTGARRPHHLRDRRRGRRQDPLEGRTGHHALRSSGHQQDRSRPACGRLARGDAARREEDARRAAVRDDELAQRGRCRGYCEVHRGEGWIGGVARCSRCRVVRHRSTFSAVVPAKAGTHCATNSLMNGSPLSRGRHRMSCARACQFSRSIDFTYA